MLDPTRRQVPAPDVHPNLIGDGWSTPSSQVIANRSPSDTDDLVGLYATANAAEVTEAVAAARAAQPGWAAAGIQARADFLERVSAGLIERKAAFAKLLAREEGKTLVEAAAEVGRAAQIFKFFAGEALRLRGETLESVRRGVEVEVRREPLGVVGLITPWNFPIAIPAWKIAPALAFGNTVVIKPAELTPGSVHALAILMVDCGCPPGVLNLVMGRGVDVGKQLVESAGVDGVSFTGSTAVGRSIISSCAAGQKKVQAEMGGKNPMLVMADADLSKAATLCIEAAFGSTGQRCTATSRIIVESQIYGRFAHALRDALSRLQIGHALDDGVDMGPVVSETQLEANLAYVQLARHEGATVVGGHRLSRRTRGFYQAPALFFDAHNDMRVSREEIFGPCAAIIEARNFEHAVELANDTPYGLTSGICTRNLTQASEFKRRSRSGMVMVNLPTAGVDYHVPFGGRHGSSYGSREQGYGATEFFTETKTLYTCAA